MLRRALRRAVDLVVFSFAVLGFCSVPLGGRTAFEHCRAVLATDAGAELGRGLATVVERVRRFIGAAGAASSPPNAAPASVASGAPADAGADVSIVWPEASDDTGIRAR